MKKVIIIGGGLGGLSAAIRLQSRGFQVTILEKEAALGGKLQRHQASGYSFDLGPSTITMKAYFEEVFTSCHRRMEDYVTFYPIFPLTKNVFSDGHTVEFTPDIEQMESQIAVFSPEDAKRYRAFLQESKKLFQMAEEQFLNRLLLSWKDKADIKLMKALLAVKPFTSVQRLLRQYFRHPHTLAMFGRYATYIGSSPYEAPAIFNMMAYLEGEKGIYGIKGGTYRLVEAFETLAKELGVQIHLNERVKKIHVKNKRIQGVETDQQLYEADQVIAGADALTVYRQLIDEEDRPSFGNQKLANIEPSLSGFVLLLGVPKVYEQLSHHNVFFPENYEQEFKDIFQKKQLPHDPTLYICYSGHSEPALNGGPGRSNLFVLANAPYVTKEQNWDMLKETYGQHMKTKLKEKGLFDLDQLVEFEAVQTPLDLQQKTGAYHGAIYGMSSNSFKQAFFRINNQSKDIEGLWFVGGTSHPGGGTPMVTKSGQLVAEAIIKHLT
ncbi:phytoene desaturase family protein [Bacillus altitudinis]|uniref:phytoene desaturase family protein n=1 Tax=Bacillus altitudinis TaxID=293387 RepID=UPI002DBD61BF|nr:phytoene desaturase family protein [Bacillus altitudinis]MEC1184442.1 phytoene desaturase family protein [Bacillus altitudinis]